MLDFIDRFRKVLEEDLESLKLKRLGELTSDQKTEFFAGDRDEAQKPDFRIDFSGL